MTRFLPVSPQHWLMESFSYTACFSTYCIYYTRALRTRTRSSQPLLTSSQNLPSRIEFSSCTICPPVLRQYQVDGAGSCFIRQVHQDDFVVHVAHLLAETLADLGVQILSTFGSFHPAGNVRTVREEACSFPSHLPLASTSCLHPKRTTHGRESHDAKPLRSCKNQAHFLSCSWYKTLPNKMHLLRRLPSSGSPHNITQQRVACCIPTGTNDKLRALLAD